MEAVAPKSRDNDTPPASWLGVFCFANTNIILGRSVG